MMRNRNQLVLPINYEVLIDENDPVWKLVEICDTLDYTRLYDEYLERKEFDKLLKRVKVGDTIVFDSVSRMSRSADDGIALYLELFDKGINLVFLKEHHIDTDTYKSALSNTISMTGDDVDDILMGINSYLKKLATRQIRLAFEQSQKEVDDLHKRTSEGIETARRSGKQIGQKSGATLHIKKKAPAKALIEKHSRVSEEH